MKPNIPKDFPKHKCFVIFISPPNEKCFLIFPNRFKTTWMCIHSIFLVSYQSFVPYFFNKGTMNGYVLYGFSILRANAAISHGPTNLFSGGYSKLKSLSWLPAKEMFVFWLVLSTLIFSLFYHLCVL